MKLKSKINIDILLFLGLLVFANTHMLMGNFHESLIFMPSKFASGEWWRLFTFPFVHAGWYHLLLDAGAFFMLYTGLEEKRISRKIFYVVICGAGSLTAVLLFSPMIYTIGLSGLSGIGHGLMAISALEMMRDKETKNIGIVCFVLVVSKSMFEAITGYVFFHLNMCGSPIAVSHAGGVLAGLLIFIAICNTAKKPEKDMPNLRILSKESNQLINQN